MTQRTMSRNGRTTPKKTLEQVPDLAPSVVPDGTLRLLKVLVQPVLILVGADGEVREVQHPAIEVKGVDWAAWAADAYTAEALEAMRRQVTAHQPEGG